MLLFSAELYSGGNYFALGLPFLLGVGMALPWPAAGAGLGVLPKPGRFMVYVKNAFGVVILLAALWYGWLGFTLLPGSFSPEAEMALLFDRPVPADRPFSLYCGVAGSESVVFAFVGKRKAAEAVQLSVGFESVAASSQHFVSVSLVPDVPHNTVVGCVEHIMKRHCQLDASHVRRKVSRIFRQMVNQKFPQFCADIRKLFFRNFSQVGRTVNF